MRRALLGLACSSLMTSMAAADIVTFRFDGMIDTNTISSGLWSFATPGEAFVVEYSFDLDAADSNPDPGVGAFSACIESFAVIAGTAFQTGATGGVSIADNMAGIDEYLATLPLTNGMAAWIRLTDGGETALSSDALPGSLDFDAWQDRSFRVAPASGPGGEVLGTITSITIVPAPGAAVVMAAGLIVGRRRRCRA